MTVMLTVEVAVETATVVAVQVAMETCEVEETGQSQACVPAIASVYIPLTLGCCRFLGCHEKRIHIGNIYIKT